MFTLGLLEFGALSLLFYYIIKYNTEKKIQYIELTSTEYNQLLPHINNVRTENEGGVPPPYDNQQSELNDSNNIEFNNIQSNNTNSIQNNSQSNDNYDRTSLPEYSNITNNEQNI